MNLTYETILQQMQSAYFESCGENPSLLSDIGARFQAVASELFNLVCYSDFALRQSFVQSASGSYLERHAALRGITRKTAAKASGEVTFYAAAESEADIPIPAHTVCSAAGEPYLQFETTQPAVIPAGELSVTVPVTALEAGSGYNVKKNTVTVIVNPPGGVDSVDNDAAFYGGWDDENDAALRRRILDSYSVAPTGLSHKTIEACVLRQDEVLDCHLVQAAADTLYMYVKTKSGTVDTALEERVQDALTVAYLLGAAATVLPATRREYTLQIMLAPKEEDDAQALCDTVRAAVREYTDSVRIGENVDLAEIRHIVLNAASARDCTVTADVAVNGVIPGTESSYLIPSSVTVACYE